ncbi:MAG: methyltransferase domain-containing protein [Pseudomonadota bacterium]
MTSLSDDLERVYGATTPEETAAAYNEWAARYDAENLAKGFYLPAVAAGLMARHLPRGEAPILDAACGTGLVGLALQVLGYETIMGVDLSEGMLGVARGRGYAAAYLHRLGTPLPEPDGRFAGAICSGAFGPGHAPPETLDELVRVTRPGGIVVFNTVSKTMGEQGFTAKIDSLTETGRWQPLEESADFPPFAIAEPSLLARLYAFRVA